jgi:hypothetical protein
VRDVTRAVRLALLFATACGRIGFDEHSPTGDAAGSDAAADPLAGCVMHLAMDETTWSGVPGEVIDSCGMNPGTAVNGAAPADDPVRGRVGMFVGGTSCVEVPDSPSLRATDALTISAWIKPAMLSPASFGVVSKRTDYMVNTEYSVFIWASNDGSGNVNELYADIDTENDRGADPTTVYADNVWHQVTVVYDGTRPASGRVQFYVDGNFTYAMPESSASITPPSLEPNLAVGCLPLSGPGQGFVGALDDVVIWRRALPSTDVAAWFAATKK